MPSPVQSHWTRTAWNREKSGRREPSHGRVCLVNTGWRSLPGPGRGFSEFISDPTNNRWDPAVNCHCIPLLALLYSPLIATPPAQGQKEVVWGIPGGPLRAIGWEGLHNTTLKICSWNLLDKFLLLLASFLWNLQWGLLLLWFLPISVLSWAPTFSFFSPVVVLFCFVLFSCNSQVLHPYAAEWFPITSWI